MGSYMGVVLLIQCRLTRKLANFSDKTVDNREVTQSLLVVERLKGVEALLEGGCKLS